MKAGPHLKTDITASACSNFLQIISADAIASAVVNLPTLPELTGLAGTIEGRLLGSKPINLKWENVSEALFHEQSTPTIPPISARGISSSLSIFSEKGSKTIPIGGNVLNEEWLSERLNRSNLLAVHFLGSSWSKQRILMLNDM